MRLSLGRSYFTHWYLVFFLIEDQVMGKAALSLAFAADERPGQPHIF